MLLMRDATDHHIMLQSGRLFDLVNPEASQIEIDDIAHGLAHTCRYAGQCNGFYSVAEHCVLVSQIVPNAKLQALFHDVAEAFIGDMARPLKQLLPDYVKIEKNIERSIFESFGIDWPPPPEVKTADYSVMAAEQLILMPVGTNQWLGDANIFPAQVRIRRLDPTKAKANFLERFWELRRDAKAVSSEITWDAEL